MMIVALVREYQSPGDGKERHMTSSEIRFPADFAWGAATAAYQIEGAVNEDGRGESIWDRYCELPGKVRNGESGAIACDHYHRYVEDVAFMRDLGLNAYRFSIAWPRIIPTGRGEVIPKGLDFYDRLVDELLESGIQPFVTLYHWDLPQALEDRGGWPMRGIVDAFLEYTEVVVNRLGDRVKSWTTFNEPWVAAWLGYGLGKFAPGRTGESTALAAAHHMLLAHGRAVEVIRRDVPDARVGIVLNLTPVYPNSDHEEDRTAARVADGLQNRWFLDPIFRATYPEDIVELYREHVPEVRGADLQEIAAPLDFLGVNYYLRHIVRADPEGKKAEGVPVRPEHAEFTDVDWEVYPDGLVDLLQRVTREYAPPSIMITENGAAFPDVRMHDGKVHDTERVRYLERHLAAAATAIASGVPLDGYFVWSLLDNFEWAMGYWKRFGLIYVDYPTLERLPKASFECYRSFIAQQAQQATTV
jgi:beta-glucosidase